MSREHERTRQASDEIPAVTGVPPRRGEERRAVAAHWFRSLAWHWVAIVAVALAAAWLFAAVGEDVFHHESGTLDDGVRSWVLAHQQPTFWAVFLWITRLGASAPMIALAIVAAAWLWHRSHRRIAAAVILAPAVASGLFNATKYTFRRVRPVGALKLHILTYAFPSGHATTSTAVLVTIAYVLAREGMIAKRFAWLVGIGGPLLIGMSRVYLDVHWTTDVLGGWALGLVVAGMSAAIYERVRTRVLGARTSIAAATP